MPRGGVVESGFMYSRRNADRLTACVGGSVVQLGARGRVWMQGTELLDRKPFPHHPALTQYAWQVMSGSRARGKCSGTNGVRVRVGLVQC